MSNETDKKVEDSPYEEKSSDNKFYPVLEELTTTDEQINVDPDETGQNGKSPF